jgi:succinate-acetate transporter protein
MMPVNVREDEPVVLSEQDRIGVTGAPAPVLSAQVFLQPIAAPSILGLYGFAGATFMVAANLAGWYGGANSSHFLFPFAAFFGGLAQFMAGMWAYKARDGLATAMHGMWGSFWMAYGLLNLLFAVGVITPPTPSGLYVELGYWFIVLAVTTWIGAWVATANSGALTGVLGFLAAGSTAMAIACLIGSTAWAALAGWLFIASAAIAWYTATALMAESGFGRAVLPMFKPARAARIPSYSAGVGEPGVMHAH